jgi:hypothetical protein
VQEEELEAVGTHRVIFGFENTTYRGDASRRDLLDYLQRVDERLDHTLKTFDAARSIDWFGTKLDMYTHFTRMIDHEVLHHGMFAVYIRLLGRRFPPSWAFWGL